MKQYNDLIQNILDNGDEILTERTGVGTIATFGEQIKFDLRKGFPAVTTKKLAWKGVISELIWFLRGSSNVHDLRAILHGEENRFNRNKKTIWDENYDKQAVDLGYEGGEMGDIYGKQWRAFGGGTVRWFDNYEGNWDEDRVQGVDQVKLVIEEAKVNPQSRRLIVNAWNPTAVWAYHDDHYQVNTAALPPCHMMFQLNIAGEYIDLQWYQRSCDVGLGLPFNIASYAALLCIFGRILGYTPRYLVGSLGNTHLYLNHLEAIKEQITRKPYPLPHLHIDSSLKTLEDFEMASVEDFVLDGYQYHESIKMKMAV